LAAILGAMMINRARGEDPESQPSSIYPGLSHEQVLAEAARQPKKRGLVEDLIDEGSIGAIVGPAEAHPRSPGKTRSSGPVASSRSRRAVNRSATAGTMGTVRAEKVRHAI
jgi:hypothetical protein